MQGTRDYNQLLSLDWLRLPNEQDRRSLLEFTRGALFSLTAGGDSSPGPLHALRVRRLFARLGTPDLCEKGLKLLALLREAEPLFGGFWLPTPFRVVEIENIPVFIGAVPSVHSLLDNARHVGLSRILTSEVARQFPRQSIETWMGIAGAGREAIVASFVKQHSSSAVAATSMANIEFLSVSAGTARTRRQFIWGELAAATLVSEKIAVCRQLCGGQYRYFSVGIRAGRVDSEASISNSFLRLLFGIAHQNGTPITATVQSGPEITAVSIAERLPIEEYRLALLVSTEIGRNAYATTFVLPTYFAATFLGQLVKLGCNTEIRK
jgi:hypothetical protein